MTIVFLTRRFYPLIGGVEKHVMEISKRLVGQGFKVIVITEKYFTEGHAELGSASNRYKGSNEILKQVRNDKIFGIEIIRINAGKENWLKKFRIWKELWKLRSVIQKAAVVHCHDVFFWYLPFRFFYPRKSVYTTFHGYESYPIRKNAIAIRKISEKLSWGNICIGDFISKWYGTKPNYVSYGAVESAEVQERKSAKSNRESALFFGRLDGQTGVLTYVKAFELLKKKFPKFELLVVGDGEQKKLVEKKVKTIGFQENPEKYFENYHFAFVSRYLSILEAFAAKRLVVAVYDDPVKEDYLRMAPYAKWIIIEKDPQMVAKRVEELLLHPELEKKMVDSAYKWVQKQTWEEMAEIYLKLWEK